MSFGVLFEFWCLVVLLFCLSFFACSFLYSKTLFSFSAAPPPVIILRQKSGSNNSKPKKRELGEFGKEKGKTEKGKEQPKKETKEERAKKRVKEELSEQENEEKLQKQNEGEREEKKEEQKERRHRRRSEPTVRLRNYVVLKKEALSFGIPLVIWGDAGFDSFGEEEVKFFSLVPFNALFVSIFSLFSHFLFSPFRSLSSVKRTRCYLRE